MTPLLAVASHFAERIKVNSIRCEIRNGERFWVKRRRPSAPLTLACANWFFRLAKNPIRVLEDVRMWQRWEVESFMQLHAGHRAFAGDSRSVAAQELPGAALAQFLDQGAMTPAMAAAAGRELARAHAVECFTFGGGWSHGDPHAGNFLYDPRHDRARLIDFEVVHDLALPAAERHADDLLVFLQDVVGRVSPEMWVKLAEAFLEGYDRPGIVERLAPRLILPRGIPRLWWAVRTTYLPGAELARRFELLRDALVTRGATAAV